MKKESKDNLSELPKASVTKLSDNERLLNDIFRPDIDKLKLFTKMLRTNRLLNKAVIIHK